MNIEELINQIKNEIKDQDCASFSRIDFKNYAEHDKEIKEALKNAGFENSVQIIYTSYGLDVKFWRG